MRCSVSAFIWLRMAHRLGSSGVTDPYGFAEANAVIIHIICVAGHAGHLPADEGGNDTRVDLMQPVNVTVATWPGM